MRKYRSKKIRIILSVMALVEVLVLAAGITFSWMEGGKKGNINGNEIVISTGSNLTMMQDGKNVSLITIPTCTLEETSSSDGRNYFFPMADNSSSNTAEMSFREGTPSDENTKYVSLDFELIAGNTATDVFLGAGTIIQSSNEAVMSALRMSFSLNDGSTPIVFKPDQMPDVDMEYSPITAISTEGEPTTTQTSTKSYGDFYYKGDGSESLFHIKSNETKHITLSIWLEGTEFSGDDVAEQDLSIYIDFSTQVDDLVKYNFVDNGHSRADAKSTRWVADNADDGKYATMMYIYDTTTSRYYAMEKSANNATDHTWTAYISKNIKNFYFRRYSIDIDEWWNEWEPDMTDIKTDPNGEHTFVSICGSDKGDEGTELDGCYGYWKDSVGTFRVYIQLESGWTDLHCYAWDKNGSLVSATGVWPGKFLTWSHNVDGTKPVYYIDLKETDNIVAIEFNNGENSSNDQRYQITDSQYFYNGFMTYYVSSTNNGKLTYTGSANSLIYPHK